eukprot:CAMPEP_0172374052 /NCGR_PEP_ID=MMETSP1060-20121228/54220_1 /TAXON_ID=37318 /ORGANISM="Pseudo-nitzschia pungens, Strain cf. cingulata" /LENGTH=414 /DNA_ID=CAMNT_0013100583 /DNA_START=45 /DNA_END=1289 /DNA_ORIENTATION=+
MSDAHNYATHRTQGNINQYNAAFSELDDFAAKMRQSRMSEASGVGYLANHLRHTASFDYDYRDENKNVNARHSSDTVKTSSRGTLEDSYGRAMNRMNRGDFDPNRQNRSNLEKGTVNPVSRGSATNRENNRENQSRYSNGSRNSNVDRRGSEGTTRTRVSNPKANANAAKRSVSNKDPSEETVAIFGAHGVTGHHFLQRALEAGYKIKALVSPGMPMNDVTGSQNLRLVTGSLEEIEKIREVVFNATYVVCLMNDCIDEESIKPPIGNVEEGYSECNLNFVHNLVPILEQSDTCRVFLYEASSVASDEKGTAPFFSKMVKKIAIRKNWKNMKKEQDRIVQYIASSTKDSPLNYIITRPSASLIWDRPSRKKLAASKSQPGPFPITNSDLAEFTLSALRMEKIYNSCPYVVQDGI